MKDKTCTLPLRMRVYLHLVQLLLTADCRERENWSSRCASLVAQGHSLNLLAQSSPVVRLQLGVFDALLTPILMELADVVHGLLKEHCLISDALLDEDTTCVLVDNRLLVLLA